MPRKKKKPRKKTGNRIIIETPTSHHVLPSDKDSRSRKIAEPVNISEMKNDERTASPDDMAKLKYYIRASSRILGYIDFAKALGYTVNDAVQIALDGNAADMITEYRQRVKEGEQLPGLETFVSLTKEDLDDMNINI